MNPPHYTEKDYIGFLRVYHREDNGKTKDNHFRDMLNKAKERGLEPHCVLFDSWYASMGNLKLVTRLDWHFLTRLKSNRLVKPDLSDYVAVSQVEVPEEGCEVHLRGYGPIKLFTAKHLVKEPEFWATDVLSMDPDRRAELRKISWKIEEFHRDVKQFCCAAGLYVTKCQLEFVKMNNFYLTGRKGPEILTPPIKSG